MTQILFYTSDPSQFGREITYILELSASCDFQFKCFHEYQKLNKYIRANPKNELIVILTALTHEELDMLISDKELFENISSVLILSDEEDDTLRKGHELHSRFIFIVDQKIDYLLSVVEHLTRKHVVVRDTI